MTVAPAWIALAASLAIPPISFAQSPVSAPPAAQKLEFDVASIRPSKSGDQSTTNVPLGPGTVYSPTGGLLNARGYTLINYLVFAYKIADYQVQALQAAAPDWVNTDRFDLEARTEIQDVSKDQLRLMMRSLLADRFKMAVHYESRQVPVLALVPVKASATGPKLRPHPADSTCTNSFAGKITVQASAGDFPAVCGGILLLTPSAEDRTSFGASNVSISFIANALSSWGNLGRPVIDRTGLTGNYDFVLDFASDPRPPNLEVDSGAPTFQQALQQQLGMKLERQKGPVDFLVLDHIEHPSDN